MVIKVGTDYFLVTKWPVASNALITGVTVVDESGENPGTAVPATKYSIVSPPCRRGPVSCGITATDNVSTTAEGTMTSPLSLVPTRTLGPWVLDPSVNS